MFNNKAEGSGKLSAVLLTGATGYLGIHILHELVENYNCKIYCMLRGRKSYSAGEFQINSNTNSSMGRLKIYAMLGVCPYEQLDVPMEFSPIDATAKAIIKLCETPRECVLFHPYSHNNTLSVNVFKAMTRCGLTIKPVERDEFNEAIRTAEGDPVKARLLTSMLAYQSGSKNNINIPRHNSYTMQVLYRMGYQWPVTTPEYLEKFINALKGLGFFEILI